MIIALLIYLIFVILVYDNSTSDLYDLLTFADYDFYGVHGA